MKATIWTILAVLCFLFIAKTTIQFKPFKVSFESIPYAIGWVLIAVGIGFIEYQSYSDGKSKGFDNCIKALKEIVKEKESKK